MLSASMKNTQNTTLPRRALARDASERLTRAMEMLGAPLEIQQRAGIYALDGLSRETHAGRELRDAIIEVLSAFVRRHAGPECAASHTSPEVQAALTALGRAPQHEFAQDRPLDLHGICLREAYLPLCHFERAFLYDCDFEGALLVGARLRGAWLSRANFTRANLDKADLRGADLSGARGLIADNLTGILWDAQTRWP